MPWINKPMNEKTSFTEYTVSNPTSSFPIGFDFSEEDNNLHVTLNGTPITDSGYVFELVNKSTIVITPEIPAGVLRIVRETDIDASKYKFTAGALFEARTMDANFEQVLESQQEVRDRQVYVEGRVFPLVNGLEEALVQADEASKAAQDAAKAAEEATALTRSADKVIDESGLTQQDINRSLFKVIGSIYDLVQVQNPVDGFKLFVSSYHPNGKYGGDVFIWNPSLSKSLHDGGYVIDPTIAIPPLATFNTYYNPVNSGNGVWVRLSTIDNILPVNYGLTEGVTAVWSCAAIQQALYKAASTNPLKTVELPAGQFRSTDVIIQSRFDGSAQGSSTYFRVPPIIGKGRFYTEIYKVTANTCGAGYLAGDVDAIILVSPKANESSSYIMGEACVGLGLHRLAAASVDRGYGYYCTQSAYGVRKSMRMSRCATGFYHNDSWMSEVHQINAINCVGDYGIVIRGGTSVNASGLYADTCLRGGIDLFGLTYSSVTLSADKCGRDISSPTGYPAFNLQFNKGLTVLNASTELHRGTEFQIKFGDGVNICAGRSFGATAVSAPVPRVTIEDALVEFNAFSWRYSLDSLTTADAAMYSHMSKVGLSVGYSFNACQGNSKWNDFPLQVSDAQYYNGKSYSAYSETSGLVTSRVSHNSGSFKRLVYAADTLRIKVLQCVCEVSDQYYEFTESIRVASVSTNSAAPTTLTAKRYVNGVEDTSIPLQIYKSTDGWLYVKPSAGGANLAFRYTLIK